MTTPKKPTENHNFELRRIQIEEMKLELEGRKLEIESEKLKVERTKAWTGNLSVVLSVLIACATIGVGIRNQSEQAKAQFEVKAAEIVMSASIPGSEQSKARTLKEMFPERLPEDFADSFAPLEYPRQNDNPVDRSTKLRDSK